MGVIVDTHNTFEDRMSYYQIDSTVQNTLKENKAQLMAAVPGILNEFYNFVTSHPVSRDKFAGRSLETLKSRQSQHWEKMFSGEFSEDYSARIEEIGVIHEKIGITPVLYVGGYNFVLKKLISHVLGACGSNKKKCEAILHAVNTVIMMDIELALTSYSNASNLARANKFANDLLDENVELSMAVNEVAIGNARMMTSLDNVSIQTQSVAAAVEEMSAGIGTISQNGEEVVQNADSVQQEAMNGRAVIEETAQNMQRVSQAVDESSQKIEALANKSQDIAGMVGSIEKIASQTNLLALNATIEAARAGDAGKGFAVVAGEVKNLANQTQKATETITNNIHALLDEIEDVVSSMSEGSKAVSDGETSMQNAVNSMEVISSSIGFTSDKMREISDVLAEQTHVANEVSGNIAEIVRMAALNVMAIGDSITSTESVVELMTKQILALSEFDIPHKSIRIAKSDHIVWKKRLADMMVGMVNLDPDELSSHLHCRLGKWYYGPDAEAVKNSPIFRELEPPHKEVHECGIEAARRYNAGDREGALEMVQRVEEASKDVVRLLDELIATS